MSNDSIDSLSRRKLLTATAVSAASIGLTGCTSDSGSGTPDESEASDSSGSSGSTDSPDSNSDSTTETQLAPVESWAWSVHVPPMQNLAKTYEGGPVDALEQPADSVGEKLLSAIQSQSNVPSASLIRGATLKNLARNGGILQINDEVKNIDGELFDVSKAKNKVDGDWYSIPNDLGPFVMAYNVDLFEEVGLPTAPDEAEQELQTWDQFIQAGKDYEKSTGNKFLNLTHNNEAHGLASGLETQNGGHFYNADGKFAFNQSANVEAMKTLKEIYDDISARNVWFGGKYWDSYRNEKQAVQMIPGWFIAFMKQSLKDMGGKWRIMRIPTFGDGPRGSNYGGVGGGVPIANSAAEKKAAVEWIQYWHGSEDAFNAKLEAGVFPGHYVEGASQATAADDYFGGQKRNQKLVASAEESPPQYQVPNTRVKELSMEAYRLILQEGQDIVKTLNSTQEKMMDEIDEQDKTITPIEA